MDLDFMSSLLDEVALEGLDGITLSMLWFRLEKRPNFPIALDDESKVFIWECIAVHKEIDIFALPEPRNFVPIYNRYEHVDDELGIVLEPPENIIDVYPLVPVKDGDIQGSCSSYKSRICITSEIRYDDVLLMSLNQVYKKWGDALVLVASPKARLLSLIGTETSPTVELSQEEYLLLERLGRSRYLGEITQGRGGLLSLRTQFSKHLHYYRKKLSSKGLATKQLYYMKSRKGPAISGSLFHLTRFYSQCKTKMQVLTKCICDILKEKPNKQEMSKVIREELNLSQGAFKKLLHSSFQKWVKVFTIPYRELYPESSVKERFTSKGQEKLVPVLRLIKHCDEEDNEEDDQTDDREQSCALNVHFNFTKIYHDLPLLLQVYRIIIETGSGGISAADIGRIVTLPKLDIRLVIRFLIKKKLIISVLLDKGRQKEIKYFAKAYEEQNELYNKIKENEAKLSEECKRPESLEVRSLKRKSDKSSEIQSCKKIKVDNEQENTNKNEKGLSEVQIPDVSNEELPALVNFTEKIIKPKKFSYLSSQLTYRKMKRMNVTLEHLKSVGIITIPELQKFLTDKEKEEGYQFKIDKKSTQRMLNRLCVEKHLKIFTAVLKLGNQINKTELICDISIKEDDPSIKLALDQIKFKMFSSRENPKKVNTIYPHITGFEASKNFVETAKNLSTNDNSKSLFSPKLFHCHPKFVRVKTFHKFLFYLVYEHKGRPVDNTKKPVVYHDSMTWKRFVPPLPKEKQEGWCFLANIYTRMPLSVFVKVVNLRQKAKEFKEYLEDEEKSHYLITYLPKSLLNILLDARKFLFSIDEVLKNLCYMGLITFGPQVTNLKEQCYIFVHSKAGLKDTTTSTPGYLHTNSDILYEKKIFDFNTLDDVERFWMELESISFHTPLGKYSSVAGKTIAITEISHKPELIEALKRKNFNEVSDTGHIPGDGLGAGGFDSALFLHSRRNWQPSKSIKDIQRLHDHKPTTTSISIQNLLKNKEILGPDNRNRLQRLTLSQKVKALKETAKKSKKGETRGDSAITKIDLVLTNDREGINKCVTNKTKSNVITTISTTSKKRKNVHFRTIKVREKRIRKPYYDEKDQVAIMKMPKARCEWLAQEDSFLLLCKVASVFLDPHSRNLVVPYTFVRDLLHEKFPEESANKSSRACQRRVRFMTTNPTTTNNLAVFLGEAKQDTELVKQFDKVKPPKANEDVWKEMFRTVVKKLEEKLTLPVSDRCKNIVLPQTLDEFKQNFEILSTRNVFQCKNIHKNPDNENEVKYFVIYFFVVSQMAIVPDGTPWPYLLYKIYQMFPEAMVKSVISHLHDEKVIARKKSTCKRDLQRSVMSSSLYRFSITYDNNLLTKFPIKIFNESKDFLDNLKGMKYTQDFELKGDVAPGYTAAIISLISLGDLVLNVKIPDQIIVFNSSLSKEARSDIVERMLNTLSDKESVELSQILSAEKNTAVSTVHNSNENIHNKENLEESSLISNEIQHGSKSSRYALYLLRQEMSQPPVEKVKYSQDYIVLNSCSVFCHSKIDHFEIQNKKTNFQNSSHLSKNIGDHKGKILTDGCISEIKSWLSACIPHGAFAQDHNFEEALEVIYDAYSPQTLTEAKNIFEEIFKAKTVGISEIELWEKFKILSGELSLFEHLHLFREAILVVRAGVASFVYLCICYAKSWVLTSYLLPKSCFKEKSEKQGKTSTKPARKRRKLNMEEYENFENVNNDNGKSYAVCKGLSKNIHFTEQVFFLPRTWRYPDGSLNKKTFIKLAQTVLSYIITSPGVTSTRVTERFNLILPPVQTLELLEILEKACCIIKYYCTKPKKQTLFSPPSIPVITKNPEPGDTDHLEALHDAFCNLARIQEAL